MFLSVIRIISENDRSVRDVYLERESHAFTASPFGNSELYSGTPSRGASVRGLAHARY